MTSRRQSRQSAVQVIYQYELSGYDLDKTLTLFWEHHPIQDIHREFCEELARGVVQFRSELDLEISAYLKNWTLDRIAILDRIVLEIGFYELLHTPQVPWKVVIDEVVRLAALFSDEKSVIFVNGILHAWSAQNRMTQDGTHQNATKKQGICAEQSPGEDQPSSENSK